MIKFQAGQILSSLETSRSNQFTGVLYLEIADAPSPTVQSLVVAFWGGMMTFVGYQLLNPAAFTELIKQKLNIKHIDAALKVSAGRVKDKDSIHELFELIARFGLLQWDRIEEVLYKDAILLLEQVLPCSGTMSPKTEANFDLSYDSDRHGFDWQKLKQDLNQRQQEWHRLTSHIPGMDAIPSPVENTSMPDDVRSHIKQWMNQNRSISEIALHIPLDPLDLAKRYVYWVNQGWIRFESESPLAPGASPVATASPIQATAPSKNLPIVLSVDDSPIVQTMIKRAISDRYQVLLANSAVTALNMLNSHPVSLLLLDVTMPDIDGLELCRTIRNISKFRNLPIVMLTAKDGLLDKVKGQFAGTTHYLTKPVDREKLLPVLEKYILVEATV